MTFFTAHPVNGDAYRDPHAAMAWTLHTVPGLEVRPGLPETVLHIAGCTRLTDTDPADLRDVTTTWDEAYGQNLFTDMCGCVPHAVAHVVLPDGTRRYRPIGVPDCDVAVAVPIGEGWQLAWWADDQAEAECLAASRDSAVLLSVSFAPADGQVRHDR
jgi:hypothetical protein